MQTMAFYVNGDEMVQVNFESSKKNACYLLSIDCVDMLHALDIMFK